MRTFPVVVERDPETSLLVGHVPDLPGAHSQGETLDELQGNMVEVVEMLLEDGEPTLHGGVRRDATHRRRLMGNVPVLSSREVIRLLRGLGSAEVRQRGSHEQFRHRDGRGTTVPFHQGRDVSPSQPRRIARDVGLTADQLLDRG